MRLAAFLAAVLFLLNPSLSLAQGPETVPIKGQLVNGTAGGPVPANVLVTLADESKDIAQATTDAEGRFQFSDVTLLPAVKYTIKLNYLGADYEVPWPPEDPAQGITITVYEVTDSPAAISLATWHILVQPGQGSLDVDEYMVFVNNSDRAYIGSQVVDSQGRKATLKFSLPKGAYGFQYMQGLMECCVVPTSNGIVDTMAVLPGSKEVFFHYFVSYSAASYDLARPVDYAVENVLLLTPAAGQQATSDVLVDRQTVADAIGKSYLSLGARSVSPGIIITARLSGLPRASLQSALRWLGAGVLALTLGVGLAYPTLRRRRKSPLPARPQPSERQRLLLEVAELDNRYERGELSETEYRAQRQPRLERLVQLSGQREHSE